MTLIRTPAVAGQFYSGNAEELSVTVATLLGEAQDSELPAPKALIVPHAGYVYSGPVAASAYAPLKRHSNQYERVVLAGPSHRTPVRGVALSNADFYRMPMGDVQLERPTIDEFDIADVRFFDKAHEYEHSLEVHLPFLQAVLGEFLLVPVVVGDARPELVMQVLEALWGGPETLIVISSDLSHYLKYDDARTIDARTSAAIERLDPSEISHDMACGATPVSGLLLAARHHGLKVSTLDLRNSGDTAGNGDFVVGYGAWAFYE